MTGRRIRIRGQTIREIAEKLREDGVLEGSSGGDAVADLARVLDEEVDVLRRWIERDEEPPPPQKKMIEALLAEAEEGA